MGNIFKAIGSKLGRALEPVRRLASRVGAWQRRGVAVQPLSAEWRVCLNCGNEFTGNFCPRCGQSAGVSRFTFKHAMLKTLDVWGLGNRSLPRTLWHLVYRPGYMIGDYLEGRQTPFFPPIKMLFLVTTAFLLTVHVFIPDAERQMESRSIEAVKGLPDELPVEDMAYSGKDKMLRGLNNFTEGFNEVMTFFNKNKAFQYIFVHSLFAVLSFWVFRRSPLRKGLTLTECFFAQIFIASQFLMLSILCAWASGGRLLHESMYNLPTYVKYLLLFYDYKQLYGFGWWRTAWNTAIVIVSWYVVMFILMIGTMAVSVVVVNN